MEMMDTLAIDVLAMQEINTSWTKEVQILCQVHGEKFVGLFRKVGSSSNKISTSLYQPGGVTLFSKGRITGRIN
eukprot:1222371-Ditylum_brightwellii.AAC.1